MHIGSTIRDNDPRMDGRTLVVIRMEINKCGWPCVVARGVGGREFSIMRNRIYDDGKARRSGFSVIPKSPRLGLGSECQTCGRQYGSEP